jgi:MoaA/NifB/PqqE/SkfB family radical SAM enzyme
MLIDTFCEFPFNRCRITCEGWVSFCCFMRPDPLFPEKDFYLGNLLENNFDEIWFGEIAEEIRKDTIEGNLHKKCQCPGCPYYSISKPYIVKECVYNEYPTFLEIDLPNTHCNVGGINPDPIKSPACIMCERSGPAFRPEKNQLIEVLKRINHIIPNLSGIHIQGIAEPFYKTRKDGYLLFDCLNALSFDDYASQIALSLTTNGTLLKEEVIKEYLERVPNSITNFSIDAATPKTFKTIRIFDCFEKVICNMKNFDNQRVRSRQFLRIHNNINTINVHEVIEMCHIAKGVNAEFVEFNPTNGFNHKILVNEKNCGLFAKAQQDIIEECKKLNQPVNFIRPLDLDITNNLIQITL